MESYAGSGFEYWRGVPCWRTDFFARAEHFGINIYTYNTYNFNQYKKFDRTVGSDNYCTFQLLSFSLPI